LNKAKVDLVAYEKQCANLTRSLATCDRSLRSLEAEKARLMRDVQAARDLAHSLDRGKDGAQKQFIAISLENERLSKQIERIDTDMDALQAKYQAEVP
jgi:chromosome segregation ATPase